MNQTTREQYHHLDRMQRRIMTRDSWISYGEWLRESKAERNRYYQWMLKQCGELAVII